MWGAEVASEDDLECTPTMLGVNAISRGTIITIVVIVIVVVVALVIATLLIVFHLRKRRQLAAYKSVPTTEEFRRSSEAGTGRWHAEKRCGKGEGTQHPWLSPCAHFFPSFLADHRSFPPSLPCPFHSNAPLHPQKRNEQIQHGGH